jgi:hypothetical protein
MRTHDAPFSLFLVFSMKKTNKPGAPENIYSLRGDHEPGDSSARCFEVNWTVLVVLHQGEAGTIVQCEASCKLELVAN